MDMVMSGVSFPVAWAAWAVASSRRAVSDVYKRQQLDAFDAARGIREVIRLWNCTQAEAARRLGLSQPALANKLRLLTLTLSLIHISALRWPS